MRVSELLLAGQSHSDALYQAVDGADPADVEDVLSLATHPDAEVRRGVAATLPLMTQGDPPTDVMVQACLTLSSDPNDDVRDWACTALGTQWREVDTPALRQALAARLDDQHQDTRCEALLGLAYRRDARVLPYLEDALTRDTGEVWLLELVAAGALSDPQLHDLVLPHLSGWDDEASERTVDLVRRLTDPGGPGDDVLDGVAEMYRRRAHSLPEDASADTAWALMLDMLEIAPHRATAFYDAVLVRLGDDPTAVDELQHHSALGQLATEGI